MSGWSSWPSVFFGYGHAGLIDSLKTSPYIGPRCSGLERITTVFGGYPKGTWPELGPLFV